MNVSSDNSMSLLSISKEDVEAEVRRLFSTADDTSVIIRVHGEGEPLSGTRADAFRELLDSLTMYDKHFKESQEITIEAPDRDALLQGLSILGQDNIQKMLFQKILLTFGKRIVEPLGALLSTDPGSSLIQQMYLVRRRLEDEILSLSLSAETQEILLEDFKKLLTDEYLEMLAEHEETVQRPHAKVLVQDILRLIGDTFRQAFLHWPSHAETIATAVSRRVGLRLRLHESPLVIRDRIVEGIEEFLWYETSTELTGAIQQLLSQKHYQSLITGPVPEIQRENYHQFARACWKLIEKFG